MYSPTQGWLSGAGTTETFVLGGVMEEVIIVAAKIIGRAIIWAAIIRAIFNK